MKNFTGYKHGTPLDNQYEHLGVTFEGFVWFWHGGPSPFPNDEWGMRAVGGAWVHFETPMQWIAAEHSGRLAFELYHKGDLIYASGNMGVGGGGNFSGLLSSHVFDMVYLLREPPGENIIFVDDLHFGPPIPAPGALGLSVSPRSSAHAADVKGTDHERLGRFHRHSGDRHAIAA